MVSLAERFRHKIVALVQVGSTPTRHPKFLVTRSGSILFSPNKDTLSVKVSEVNKDFRDGRLVLTGTHLVCIQKLRVRFSYRPPISLSSYHRLTLVERGAEG